MLTKRGRFYWADIYINGKRIRRSLKTAEKLVALDRLRVLQDKLLATSQSKDIRFEDFCAQYLEWAWQEKPASTLREKQRLEKIKVFFRTQDIEYLSEITPYHIEQLKGWLKAQDKPKLSKSTINRYLQIVRGMFYKAIDWEVYSGSNPVKKVRFYKESPQVHTLTPDQLEKVLQASREITQDPQSPIQKVWLDIVLLALNTGMRKSEILNLKWKDIKNEEVIVSGKGDKTRTIPLNDTALQILEGYPEKDRFVFDLDNRNDRWVIRRTVDQVRKRTGIPFRFHQLRHRFATSLVEKGCDFVTISELLGHSKLTTSLIYSHTDKDRKRQAVESLSRFKSYA